MVLFAPGYVRPAARPKPEDRTSFRSEKVLLTHTPERTMNRGVASVLRGVIGKAW